MSVIPYSTGNFPIYRFYITITTLTYEVFPLNFIASKLVDEPLNHSIEYRRMFNGSLLFGTNSIVIDEHGVEQNRKDDWTFFWGIEQTTPCAKLYFTITKNSVNIPFIDAEIYWEGYFATSDGKFDIDNCTFEVEPLTNDKYVTILELADLQHNILDITTIITAQTEYPYYNYTKNRWLSRLISDNVLEYLAGFVSPLTTVSSDFFTAAVNPVTLDDNLLLYLIIAQKSDIVYPGAAVPATTAMMSWNQLMDILWGMFQVTWNYDDVADNINVEHISWWTPGAGIDLRTQLATQATNKYSYTKEVMPKYERFIMAEADDPNFIGADIWYDSSCVDSNSKTNIRETAVNVTTDIDYIENNPENIASEGFVIMSCLQTGGVYYIISDFGKYITTSYKNNMPMSWANLQNSYFRHDRVLISGYMNNNLETFVSSQKVKQQECSAILCTDYDPRDVITTELGETYFAGEKAQVANAEISPSGEVKFKLLYGPVDNVNTGVANEFNVYAILTMTDPDNYFIQFYFNVISAGINIRVREFVYDNLNVLQSTGGWNVVTLAVNTLSVNMTDSNMTLAAGWTIQIEIEYTTGEIDILYGEPCSDSYSVPFIYTAI